MEPTFDSTDIIYLDNAATVFPKPAEVLDKALELYKLYGVNPGRSGYDLCLVGGDLVETTRREMTEFFGGTDFHRLCFAYNASEALNILIEEKLPEHSMEMGEYLVDKLRKIDSPLISEIRGSGLFVGIEIDPALGSAREICERLMDRGLLSKETHETVVRLAPPLIVTREQLDWAVDQIQGVLQEMDEVRLAS